MATCDPSTTISAEDISGLKADITTIDTVVESSELTTTTKNGVVIDTLAGRLLQLGFLPPVVYAAGITFTDQNDLIKTIDRSGIVYAPAPSAIPFTTSGTWVGDDDGKFYVVQQEIQYRLDSIAALRAQPAGFTNWVEVQGYYGVGTSGGGAFYWDAASTDPDDGGFTILPTSHVGAGRWKRPPGDLATVDKFGAVADWTGTPGVGTDNAPFFQAAQDYCTVAATSNAGIPLEYRGGASYRLAAPVKMKAFVDNRLNQAYIAVDYDGYAFEGGALYGADPQYLYIEKGFIQGINPETRPNQGGVRWHGVFVDSEIHHLKVTFIGQDGINLIETNAVKMSHNFVNRAGRSPLYMRDCSALTVVGGAYEGAETTDFTGVGTYGPTGKSIWVDNTTFGDYAPSFQGVQTERGAYGMYIDNCRGLSVSGYNAHSSPATPLAQVYLTANTAECSFFGLRSVGYATLVDDQANGVAVASTGEAANYVQSRFNSGGDVRILAGSLYAANGIIGGVPLNSGRLSFQTVTLADDAIHTFDAVGGNNRAMYFLTNLDRASGQAQFSANLTDVPSDLGSAANVSYGNVVLTPGTADGVDGDVNIYPASTTQIGVKNRLSFSTTFTLLALSVG